MQEEDRSTQDFWVDETAITRQSIRVSMRDGARLQVYRHTRADLPARGRNLESRSPVPLLCVPDELGNSRELHGFILSLMALKNAPMEIYSVDLRGRGNSEAKNIADSDLDSDADDLISVCDALGLHHVDILVSGRGVYPVVLSAPKRPGLIRRLILNDAAGEFDAVGIARLSARSKRSTEPKSWEEAVDQLQELNQEQFPNLDREQWRILATTIWNDAGGKPERSYHEGLLRLSNSDDFDSKQPDLWTEMKILTNRPSLLLRGENSLLVTREIANQMADALNQLSIHEIADQGHVPLLNSNDLPETILTFLNAPTATLPAH